MVCRLGPNPQTQITDSPKVPASAWRGWASIRNMKIDWFAILVFSGTQNGCRISILSQFSFICKETSANLSAKDCTRIIKRKMSMVIVPLCIFLHSNIL